MAQIIKVDVTPSLFQPTLYYHQGDIGREFAINISTKDGYEIPSGATVKIEATKPSGFGFSVTGSLSNNVVSFVSTEGMTDEFGRFPAQLEITSGNTVIYTANFLMVGEKNTHPDSTVDGSQETVIPQLTLLVERVENAAAAVLDTTTVATTLPAGSQATYSFDEETNTATFGIPQGEAGAGAAGVVASAYSASKTYAVGDYAIHNSNLYRCTTAITTAESFTASHWTQVVLGDDVTDLKNDVTEISLVEKFRSTQKINKGIDGVTFLLVDRSGNTTITNAELIYASHDLELNVESGYMYIVATYSAAEWTTANHLGNTPWQYGNFFIPKGTYFALQIMRTDRTAFTNGESDKTVVSIKELLYSDDMPVKDINDSNGNYALRQSQKLNYQINGVTFLLEERRGNDTITTTRILYAKHKTICRVESGYKYIVATYSSDTWSTQEHIANTSWQTGEYVIPKGTYYAIQLRRSDNSAFTHYDADKYVFTLQELAYLDDLGEKPTLYHILVTGQSLGVGAEGNPALTTTTPYEYIGKTYQFNGGSRPIDGMENDTGVEEIAILDKCLEYFGSLCEETHILNLGSGEDARHAYQGETISSAMGYWFNKITGQKVLVSNHSFGGKSYNGLKKGSIAYGNSIRAVHHAKAICDQLGWDYVVYAVAVVHGEADLSGGVSAETYKGYLNQWQSDYDGDIKAITGQTQDVQMFVSQTAAASSYGLSESPVPNGVFLASIENANIHLVAPQYCYPITYASIHMNNRGYRALGEFFGFHIGRKFNKVFNTCLYPIKSELDNTKITLTFNDGVTIVYDGNFATPVSDGHWGFELIDNESNATITNVAIVNNKVEITLSAVPSSNAHISYAYKVLSDEIGKIGYQNGVRGNLRNTFAFDSLFSDVDTVVPQWCAIFSIPVSWQA